MSCTVLATITPAFIFFYRRAEDEGINCSKAALSLSHYQSTTLISPELHLAPPVQGTYWIHPRLVGTSASHCMMADPQRRTLQLPKRPRWHWRVVQISPPSLSCSKVYIFANILFSPISHRHLIALVTRISKLFEESAEGATFTTADPDRTQMLLPYAVEKILPYPPTLSFKILTNVYV